MRKLIIICLAVISAFSSAPAWGLHASALGPLYGDAGGLGRVQALEEQLQAMTIKSGHPRIVLTPELVAQARQRVAANHYKWSAILTSANGGNSINAAFAYLMLKDSNPTQAAAFAAKVYGNIMLETATPWAAEYTSGPSTLPSRKVAEWAIAFDWAYDGLTVQQRSDLIAKIAATANIAGRAAWIAAGNRDTGSAGDTLHREEWIFYAWKAWPELALAGEFPDADTCYKARWRYDWAQGDAARAYAYLNDGTPLEGYQYGADATSWFMALKSATGINLVDGDQFKYDISAADYQLYATDFGLNRNIFHHGVGIGAAGLVTYTDTTGDNRNWKVKEYHSMATQLAANKNPYQQWFAKNPLTFDKSGASSWIFTNEYYTFWSDFENIATLLFYDPKLPAADPRLATYEELPYAKHFPGGNEVYMRSSWSNDAAMACFRSTPAFTKTSHGDFDVNTFILYRKGNLAPDSGVYDVNEGQTNYFGYQKNTVAHNDMLIVDPSQPNAPTKLSSSKPDPGGTELVSTRTFGNIHPIFPNTSGTFLLNKKANWGDIIAFETTKEFDWVVGDGAPAYGNRVDEYTRSLLFLRKPGDKAYVVILDRVGATNANFQKKWLIHTVNEPQLNGSVLDTEVPGNIYTTDGDSYSATNAFNNSAMYGKILLPQEHKVRKVGGAGYEFWVDGTTPRNWPIDWTVQATNKEKYTGGPIQEIGQWRLELMPARQQARDLFLNAIYLGDAGETPAPMNRIATSVASRTGVVVEHSADRYDVVVLNTEKFGAPSTDSFDYSVPAGSQTAVQHVVTELAPGTEFQVMLNGAVVSKATSSANGVLSFSSQGGGTFTIAPATASVTPDSSRPTITDFALPATATTRTVSIANLVAIDDRGVTGYLVSESPATPDPSAASWSAAAPTSITFSGEGARTAYAWAKDAAGNISLAATASVTISLPDVAAPMVVITSPSQGASVTGVTTVSVTANDNVGVNGVEIYLGETRIATLANAPYLYELDTTALANGVYSISARAFDAAGNVGYSANVPITVYYDRTAPTVTSFAMPAITNTTTVTVSAFTAVDNSAVTGYLITETAGAPSASAAGWSNTVPTSFTFAGTGSRTAYAWVRDSAGNVSMPATAQVVIDTVLPIISSMILKSESSSVSVKAAATDDVAIGKMLLYVDSQLQTETTQSTLSYIWSPSARKSQTMTLVVYDKAGNMRSQSLKVVKY